MIERIYHSFEKWEDFKWGMYDKTCYMDETQMVHECAQLLSCPEWFYEAATFVAHNWFFAAEHNLSNTNRNRQAWLGQAACNMTHGAPEYLTKIAWNTLLNDEQRKKANDVADEVIQNWEELHHREYFKWQKSELEKMCSSLPKNESLRCLIHSNGYT